MNDMTKPAAPGLLTPLDLMDKQVEYARVMLKFAQTAGFYLMLHERFLKEDGKTFRHEYWPAGMTPSTVAWAQRTYEAWADTRRKRAFVVLATCEPRTPGTKLIDQLTYVSLEAQDRIALRALNAPLQVLSDGVDTARNRKHRDRLVYATKVGDRIQYRAANVEGAQAMWRILMSDPVQRMLHHGDHYSRARRAGED